MPAPPGGGRGLAGVGDGLASRTWAVEGAAGMGRLLARLLVSAGGRCWMCSPSWVRLLVAGGLFTPFRCFRADHRIGCGLAGCALPRFGLAIVCQLWQSHFGCGGVVSPESGEPCYLRADSTIHESSCGRD